MSWAMCKSAPRPRPITMPAPHHSVIYRLDALPATQPTVSKYWRHTNSRVNSWEISLCVCVQPPTPEQLEVDIKVEAIKKEISDLVSEVSCPMLSSRKCEVHMSSYVDVCSESQTAVIVMVVFTQTSISLLTKFRCAWRTTGSCFALPTQACLWYLTQLFI